VRAGSALQPLRSVFVRFLTGGTEGSKPSPSSGESDPATIGDAPVTFFPEEGWLDPVVYAHAMLSAARLRHGAKVICGARVVDLIMAGDRARSSAPLRRGKAPSRRRWPRAAGPVGSCADEPRPRDIASRRQRWLCSRFDDADQRLALWKTVPNGWRSHLKFFTTCRGFRRHPRRLCFCERCSLYCVRLFRSFKILLLYQL
jgi:hypothetical protein